MTRPNSTVGPRATPVGPDETLTVEVATGMFEGNCFVPTSATAIVMNTTAVGATGTTFVTVYPSDASRPEASNLNTVAGKSPTPNLVTVSLSAMGSIDIYNAAGSVHIIADIAGFYEPIDTSNSVDASVFIPMPPCRLLDTRPSSNIGPRDTPIGENEVLTVQVTGTNGNCMVPPSATSVVMNVTTVNPTAASFVSLFPIEDITTTTSNLNTVAGQPPTPNLVTVRLPHFSLEDGGAIGIFNRFGSVDIIGDIAGFYEPAFSGLVKSPDPTVFVPVTPCRLLDTRSSTNVGPRAAPVGPNDTLTVQVTGSNGNCVVPASATALVMNATTVGASATSFVTVFPADVALPDASNLNTFAGQSPTPNLVVVSLSTAGVIKIYNNAGTVDIIGDVAGYFELRDTPGMAGLVTTFAGGTFGSADGTGTAAQFATPVGVDVDGAGNVYVADQANTRIRKISASGVVTTLAGSTAGYNEGAGGVAQFNGPVDVAVDAAGNVYVADSANQRIRKISSAGVVTTLAGSTFGYADGTGAAAKFANPTGVAVDAAGNVFVADTNNHRIRKITSTGVVTTVAGSTFGFNDGAAALAQFALPSGIDVDDSGTLYIADTQNERIRKVTPAGVVSTLAGSIGGFADGVGNAARLHRPTDVAVDSVGNVLFVGEINDRVRQVTPAGVVSTLAGGAEGYVDGVAALARFDAPVGIAVDSGGNVFVADGRNDAIRRLS